MSSEDVDMVDMEEPDAFVAQSHSFMTWLQQQGTSISPKIELADLRQHGAGRGVLAKEDIAEDEELFSVPRSSVLTIESSTLPAEVKAKVEDPWLGLILAMAFESQQGTQSIWKPYFDVLPAEFDTLMFWSDEERQFLQGSAVLGKIGKASADKTFTEQVISVIKEHASAFRANDVSDAELLALCHRMGSTIMAYAFDLEKPGSESQEQEEEWEEDQEESESTPKGMIPLADMLNADADRNNAKLYYEEDKVVMKSIKRIEAGEEIFNDYGSLPSADVLRRYGYVTSNYAKYDVVEVTMGLIKDAAKEHLQLSNEVLERRTQYLDEQGVLDDAYDIARSGNEDIEQFSEELCMLLNALASPQADFDKLMQKEKLPKPALTSAAAGLLSTIVQKRRLLYPASKDGDGRLPGVRSGTSDPTYRRRTTAQHVIQGEQQVLAEALHTLEAMTASTGEKRKADTDTGRASKKSKG